MFLWCLCYQSTNGSAHMKARSSVLQGRGAGLLEWLIWTRAYSCPQPERPQERRQGQQPAAWGQPAGRGPTVASASHEKAPSPRLGSGLGSDTSGQRAQAHHRGMTLESWCWRKRLIHVLWVNYKVGTDELGRDLKTCKVFAIVPVVLPIEVAVTRQPDPADCFRCVNGVCVLNRV